MSFPRYPAYKPSGVEWLGEVPEHWDVDRMKWAIEQPKNGIWGNEECGDENDVPCVRVADFDRQKMRVSLNDPTIRNVTPKERDGRVLTKNDLLIEKSGGGELQPVGYVVLYEDNEPAICSNFVAKASVRHGMSASYWRYLHSAAYTARINTRSIKQTSGIQNLDQSQYLNESTCYPPHHEQVAIATFLDRETAKLDALIAEQQRLIELLQEKRQAVISHAVTKGLNPDAPMKDSGVEWLGEVPEHWRVNRFKLSIESCINGVWGDESCNNGNDVTCIRVADFDRHRLEAKEPEEPTIRSVSNKDIEQRSLRFGDLLVEKSGGGEKQPVGAVVLYMGSSPSVCSNFVARMRLATGMNSSFWRYAHHAAYSLRVNTRSIKQTSGIQNLDQQQYFDERVAYPPAEEQEAISDFLNQETAKIDTLIVAQNRLIGLLQERRSALISAAVTGQIDVRGLAPEANAA